MLAVGNILNESNDPKGVFPMSFTARKFSIDHDFTAKTLVVIKNRIHIEIKLNNVDKTF